MGKQKRRKRKPSSGEPRRARTRGAKGGAPKAKRKRAKAKGAGIRCPLCEADARSVAANRAQCGTCGVLFPEKIPALPQLMKARDQRFRGHSRWSYLDDVGRAKVHAEEAMRGFFRIRTGKPAALNGFGRRVLEVNCGYGNMLRIFQKYGWTAAGTETNPVAFFRAQQDRLQVRRELFLQAAFARAKFDLVVFRADFGEIVDPRGAVEKLRGLLKSDGLVCVLHEPLASRSGAPETEESNVLVHTAESLKRAFCDGGFVLATEEPGKGTGTFWFQTKPRG